MTSITLDHEHEPDWMSECVECIALANELDEETDKIITEMNKVKEYTL